MGEKAASAWRTLATSCFAMARSPNCAWQAAILVLLFGDPPATCRAPPLTRRISLVLVERRGEKLPRLMIVVRAVAAQPRNSPKQKFVGYDVGRRFAGRRSHTRIFQSGDEPIDDAARDIILHCKEIRTFAI
jgi:hypothetical protein